MVIAVTGLARAAGCTWADAVALANAAAGVEVTRVGIAALTRDEIAAALTGHDDPIRRKVSTLEAFVAGPLAELRRKKRSVVYTNGCFDILHVGHIHLLQFAREQGDYLVVGLNRDASIRRLKGPGRPILDERDRANLLAALASVDCVLPFAEDTPLAQIAQIVPDVLVKAADYDHPDKTVVGRGIVEGRGGRVAFGKLVGGVSTTEILQRAKRATEIDQAAGRAARAAADVAYAAVEADRRDVSGDESSGVASDESRDVASVEGADRGPAEGDREGAAAPGSDA